MAGEPGETEERSAGSAGRPGGQRQSRQTGKQPDGEIRRLSAQDANHIVAEAYREAARIVDEAKQRVEYLYGQAGRRDTDDYTPSGDIEKYPGITQESYEQLDDLFVEIRYQLQGITQYNRVTADKLLELVNQLEYYVDSLVVDSLKLRNIQYWLQGTTTLARRLRAKLDRG